MKVKELRTLLESLPDDMLIVMSSDSEGNGYSPLAGDCVGKYVPENTWCGAFYDILEYEDEVEDGMIDENDTVVDALALWPTN
jgi:hypothetical protein